MYPLLCNVVIRANLVWLMHLCPNDFTIKIDISLIHFLLTRFNFLASPGTPYGGDIAHLNTVEANMKLR